jgi:methyl-accepting chemotaxis protein
MVAVSAVLIFSGKASRARIEQSLAKPVNVGKKLVWQMAMEEHLNRMKAQAGNLEMAYEIKTALKEKNNEELKKQADVFFDLMKDQGVFSSLQIADADGELLYASPEKVSGKSVQQTVHRALASSDYASGIEYDASRNLVLGFAIPIKSRKGLYGVGVYNMSLEAICRSISESDGGDVFIVNEDGGLHAGSNHDLYRSLTLKYPVLGSIDLFTALGDDSAFSIAVQPLPDADNQAISHLVSVDDATETYNKSRKIDYLQRSLMAVSIAAALVCLGIYTRRALKPLDAAVNLISEVARGDFTGMLDTFRKDEIGALLKSLNRMTVNLRGIFKQISDSGKDLATGAASQAASLEDAAASLDQMASLTKENTEKATRGTRNISEAHESMVKAGSSMSNVKRSIEEISDTSGKIQAISTTIDSIAFKTNLLALNAAVEAARAGEAGAGFAVVAEEVRNLALHAAEAARDISGLVQVTEEKIRENAEVTKATEAEFKKAVADITGAKSIFNEIAQSAIEQSNGISSINTSVSKINKGVQENLKHSDRVIVSINKFRFNDV